MTPLGKYETVQRAHARRAPRRHLMAAALCVAPLLALGPGTALAQVSAFKTVAHLSDFQVVEFRRYTITPGGRDAFASYFESYFPESFEQLGAIAFGQFAERANPAGFTWLRGFRNMEARAIVNAAFYYGPLWKEHKATLNALIVDSDNVMLMRPLRQLPVLPAVDPVKEAGGAHGVVVAQIFTLNKGGAEAFAPLAESAFASYRAAGAYEAGVLVTLDAPNNFPQLPVRGDGPHLVWLGVLKDDQMLAQLQSAATRAVSRLVGTGLLRGAPELVVLDPARRSRLRWLAE